MTRFGWLFFAGEGDNVSTRTQVIGLLNKRVNIFTLFYTYQFYTYQFYTYQFYTYQFYTYQGLGYRLLTDFSAQPIQYCECFIAGTFHQPDAFQ
ncbi:hypothetical protein SAMN03080615_02484 [Amphritea atlantica]|uniref:Uncharacterized protein n=1 Tax=Amphritea atlantica TaxID=355243 RepID=A0A1H9I7U9_9GAMM|nr:hypothetical protein SAMN03080615_02484 [Amphritea atlantica]